MSDPREETELFLRDGETWVYGAPALLERYGGLYLSQNADGDLYMGIPGQGEIPVADLLLKDGKPRFSVVEGGK